MSEAPASSTGALHRFLASPDPRDTESTAVGLRRATRFLMGLTVTLAILLAAQFVLVSLVRATTLDTQAEAINLSGRQRLLVERSARIVSQLGLDPDSLVLVRELAETAEQMDRAVARLLTGVGDAPPLVSAFSESTREQVEASGILQEALSFLAMVDTVVRSPDRDVVEAQSREIGGVRAQVVGLFDDMTRELQVDNETTVASVHSWETAGFAIDGALLIVAIVMLIPVVRRVRWGTESLALARDEVFARESQLEAIIEHIPDGLVMTDLRGAILRVNDKVERMFGYERGELIGANAQILVSRQEWQAYEEHETRLGRSLGETHLSASLSISGARRDGSTFPTDVAISAIRVGEEREIIATIRDVTAQHETQRQLRELSDDLSRSNEDLNEFASVAAHDLQEPLRKIRMFGDRLRTSAGDSLDERSQDSLDRILDGATRMQGLINDLLAYSRLSSRAQPFGRVDLGQVMREVESELGEVIDQTSTHLEVTSMPTLEAEPTQMYQLLANLVHNGIKYVAEGTAPHVLVRGEVINTIEGTLHRIVIRDNGIGFDPAHSQRIFGPFERLHGRFEYPGTGMGLAICRKIVTRHHGKITAEGRPGEGSTFTVTLPSRQPDASSGGREEIVFRTNSKELSQSAG